MPSTYDYTLTGDPAVAHGVVIEGLASIGHQVAALADGTFAVTRGSGAATVLLGAFAGKRFHTKFSLQFFDGEGSAVARFTRVGALGGLKGGVIGNSKTIDVFNEAARTIETATRQAGIFAGVTEHS
jgi:hypothetical protein